MHEIGVLNEAVKTIEKVAADNNISNIKQVTLEVGELSGYLPVFFEKYFDVLTENKPLFKDCELKITVETGEDLCSPLLTLALSTCWGPGVLSTHL